MVTCQVSKIPQKVSIIIFLKNSKSKRKDDLLFINQYLNT